MPLRARSYTPLVALCLTALAHPSRAHSQPLPSVELYTMGPGRDVFSRFGHAALCVRDAASPEGRCYNYGTTDFSTPVPLTWNVLRGRARFWVSLAPLDRMVAWYGAEGEDRTVYRQRITLPPDALEALETRLLRDVTTDARSYVYHHFRDNCTTRLRDHLDAVTHGALSRGTAFPHGPTWRALVLDGLSSDASLLVAGELLLGRPLDARPTRWEAMFLPAVLRDEVHRALGARPDAVYTRRGAPPRGDPARGRHGLLALAVTLAALAVHARTRTVACIAGGALLGLAGLVVWTLSLASSLPELSTNDLRAVLLPTDLALPFLRGRSRAVYARVRLAMALLASLASATGITPQPLLLPCLVVAAVMAPWAFEGAPRAQH